MTQIIRQFVQVQTAQNHVQGLGTHFGDELIGVIVFEHLIALGQRIEDIQVFFLRQEIHGFNPILGFNTGIDDHVTFVINDGVELLGGQSQQVADFIGQRTEVPDVGNGNHQGNVSHSFTSHLLLSNFHSTTVTYNAPVTDALVFSAVTLIILNGTENPFATKAVPFGLISTVIDRLRLQHFPAGALQNFFRGGQTYRDLGKITL